AVLEVGLGGRLDATTTARPRLTAIARVGMDHMEFLGDTLEAIAREKAAILRKGVPAVVAEQRPEALAVLEACASSVGAPLLLEGRDFSLDGLGRYRGPELALDGLALSLHGAHQHHNAAVAVTCARLLEKQGVPVGAEDIRTGLQRTRWPGRLEQVPGHPPLLLDGAHNEDGVAALVAALGAVPYAGRLGHVVFGVVWDKRVDPMLRMLLPRCASATFTPVPTPRSLDPASYLPFARSLRAAVDVAPSPEEALARARVRAGPDAWGLVAGSLYLVGAVKALLGHPPCAAPGAPGWPGTTTHGAWVGAAPTLKSKVDASSPNARPRRTANGGRGRVPGPLPEVRVPGGDDRRVDADGHPLRAGAAALPSVAARRAAAPGARLLPEPAYLDQRRVRQEPPVLRPGHPHRGAPRPRQEQPAAAARALRADRPPAAPGPRLRLGSGRLPAERPSGGCCGGEGEGRAAARLLRRTLHG